MRRFYVFWFFFSAGWGYLMSQPFPGFEPKAAAHILGALPLGALMTFVLLGIEAWRMRPGKLPAPRIELKPWQMPTGVMQFVFITFLFSGFWGVVFGLLIASSDFREPLFVFLLSVGGLVGIVGIHRVFQTRFAT